MATTNSHILPSDRIISYTAENLMKEIGEERSTPGAVMLWKDGTGRQADDSKKVFGHPNGAATLNGDGVVPGD
jgi:hypothetical protein